jgi:hypothetical protein
MLKNFISYWESIKAVIYAFEETFKKKEDILFSNSDINYLKLVLYTLSIFIETTTKLKAKNYPIIYYIIPYIYILHSKLKS